MLMNLFKKAIDFLHDTRTLKLVAALVGLAMAIKAYGPPPGVGTAIDQFIAFAALLGISKHAVGDDSAV